jgi:hypothetical protein
MTPQGILIKSSDIAWARNWRIIRDRNRPDGNSVAQNANA